MYRIKFPSGEVATIESPEALTEAVRNGSVTSYCFILHERTGQWLPIVRHPHYHRALTARGPAPAAGPDVVPILPDPLDAPAAATKASAKPERTTAVSLDPPNFDELLEMMDTSPAPEAVRPAAPSTPKAAAPPPPPAADAPRPRGRSRELEFLYVPESKAAGQPRTPPRTAGPPPRPQTPAQKSAPPAAPAPAAAPAAKSPSPVKPAPAPAPRDTGPKAEAPTAPPSPRVAPAPSLAPTVMQAGAEPVRAADPVRTSGPSVRQTEMTRQTEPVRAESAKPPVTAAAPEPVMVRPEPALARPEPALARPEPARDPEPVRSVATAPAAAPVATLAPPRRKAERYDRDLIDPVEAALSLEGPAPIELRLPAPRHDVGGSRRLFVLAGLAVLLGGGLLTWSPWSGAAKEVAAATSAAESPAKPETRGADAAPAAEPAYDMDAPAEEEPVIDLYSVSPDSPYSARTSFGGTAAQAGAVAAEPPAPGPAAIPGKPKTMRVAVPVLGSNENPDSVKLAAVKRAITQ